jgi:hypothetical protein
MSYLGELIWEKSSQMFSLHKTLTKGKRLVHDISHSFTRSELTPAPLIDDYSILWPETIRALHPVLYGGHFQDASMFFAAPLAA